MTDNHSYDEPTLGSTSGWGSQLNSNFRDLDTDVEIRDTDANKGNYTPKDGALYRATDTGAIYQGDGTSWVLADMEVNSLSTEQLVDASSGNSYDVDAAALLAAAGYSSGDFVPVSMISKADNTQASTTSTTFTKVFNMGFVRTHWADYTPDDTELAVRLTGGVTPGTGESVDIRYQIANEAVTFGLISNITSVGNFDSGVVTADISGVSGVTGGTFQFRTDPGSNSSSISEVALEVGFKL